VNNPETSKKFSLKHYPTFFLYHPKYDAKAEYHWQGPDRLVEVSFLRLPLFSDLLLLFFAL
jgi:hypothetical protein